MRQNDCTVRPLCKFFEDISWEFSIFHHQYSCPDAIQEAKWRDKIFGFNKKKEKLISSFAEETLGNQWKRQCLLIRILVISKRNWMRFFFSWISYKDHQKDLLSGFPLARFLAQRRTFWALFWPEKAEGNQRIQWKKERPNYHEDKAFLLDQNFIRKDFSLIKMLSVKKATKHMAKAYLPKS